MSTGTKIPLAEAECIAGRMRELFRGTYGQWTIAGSIRRRCEIVGDCEHVVVPAYGGLFGEGTMLGSGTNLLWERADNLVSSGNISRALYTEKSGPATERWGDRYRGILYGGMKHEIFTATEEALGSILAIRTGPADFSRKLVTGLLRNGRRNFEGAVWRCDPCECGMPSGARNLVSECEICEGTGLRRIEKTPTPTEESFFDLCGEKFVEPEKRV